MNRATFEPMPRLPNRRARRAWMAGRDSRTAEYIRQCERRGGFADWYQWQRRAGMLPIYRTWCPPGETLPLGIEEEAQLTDVQADRRTAGYWRVTIFFDRRAPIAQYVPHEQATTIFEAWGRFALSVVPYGLNLLQLAERFGLSDREAA